MSNIVPACPRQESILYKETNGNSKCCLPEAFDLI